MVGEIFCRLNQFANADVVRLVEEQGGECWLAGIGEWVWYTDDEHRRRLIDEGRKLSREAAVRMIKAKVMRRDEHAVLGPFADDFAATKRSIRYARCSTAPGHTCPTTARWARW